MANPNMIAQLEIGTAGMLLVAAPLSCTTCLPALVVKLICAYCQPILAGSKLTSKVFDAPGATVIGVVAVIAKLPASLPLMLMLLMISGASPGLLISKF